MSDIANGGPDACAPGEHLNSPNPSEAQPLGEDNEDEILLQILEDVKRKDRREELPFIGERPSFSLWSALKSAVGKDLTKVTMPIHFNEPLSFTQRLVEDLEYAQTLHAAADCSDSLERLAHVAAFACSCYGSALDRHYKPFNPLLGETFDTVREDLGFAVLTEQVCHHPPVTVMHCVARKWKLWQEYKLETRFRGNHIRVIPTGIVHLQMGRQRYTWNKPQTTIHNIIIGRLWLEHEGEVLIRNHTTKESASVNFYPYNKQGKNFRKLRGCVRDASGVEKLLLTGAWDEGLSYYSSGSDPLEARALWMIMPKPVRAHQMFGFTQLAVQLNEPPHDSECVCPSDSRLRPDQRLFEEAHVDHAAREKHRVEEKQRAARRAREHSGEHFKARWFVPRLDECTGMMCHAYRGGYWTMKQKGLFPEGPDIF